MSAFLTSNETRAMIAAYLINNDKMIRDMMKEELFYQNYNVSYLYRILSSLNIYAIAERYSLKYAEDCSNFIKYNIDFSKYSDVDTKTFMVKVICFVYQCNEGVIADNKVISFLENLYNKMLNTFYDGNLDNVMFNKERVKLWN